MYAQPVPSLYHNTAADLVTCPEDKDAKRLDVTD